MNHTASHTFPGTILARHFSAEIRLLVVLPHDILAERLCRSGSLAPTAFRLWAQVTDSQGETQMPATEILQQYLDLMSDSVLRGNFEAYAAHIDLPFNLVTSSASLYVETMEDMQDGFDDFVDMIESQGVTALIRIAKGASFDGNDMITGWYETNLLKGAQRIVPAFFSKVWLRNVDGVWKASKITNTTKDDRWPIQIFKVEPADSPPMEFLK
jgi:hypothetical protein